MTNRLPKGVLPVVTILAILLGHRADAASRAEAYVGDPFGVGRVVLSVMHHQPALPLFDERFAVREEEGRVLYPAIQHRPARKMLRQLLEIETPSSVSIYFLFRGDQPFDLLGFSPEVQAVRVKPTRNSSEHRRLMQEWWEQYAGQWQRLRQDPQFPPIAENFLAANLARRLGLTLPTSKSSLLPWKRTKESVWDDLLASEAHQLKLDRALLADATDAANQLQPLPAPRDWAALRIDHDPQAVVETEPIAAHVPQECFYLRFGTFTNYLWFRDLQKRWQGDLQNMIARRAVDRAAALRTQRQLSLRETALAKLLGPQVIADVAIIGLDPYVGSGAAVGLLFQAKNSELLSHDLTLKRREALRKFPSATESTITLAEHDVSLISTPDGQVRSYYAQDGVFHLVTTSRTLVERFYQAGQADRSLASLPSFLHARAKLPLERNDTLFAFISEQFFQQLCSPHYRVELGRRLRSSREAKLVELAHLSAVAEGSQAATRDELIGANFLPADFASRSDGSRLEQQEDALIDSLRGKLGCYVPIGDMPIEQVTAAEAEAYQRFAERFQTEIGRMPPIAAAVRRVPLEQGGETMAVDLILSPVAGLNLGSMAELLGEPSDRQLRPVAGDVIAAQAALSIPVPLVGGEKQPHLLFGALRDFRSPLVAQRGTLVPNAAPTELVRGYLGAWPRPGLLELLIGSAPAGGTQPQPAGDQLWQAQQDDFLLLAFKPDVIDEVLPQLAWEPAERPAQVRLRIDDLTGKQLAETVNSLGYMRARETSVSASRLMNTLANQLLVPPDACRALAERLVDGRFACPLGGEYQLFEPHRGLQVWASSALPQENRFLLSNVPEDYQLPLLSWFRGLQGDLQLTDEGISAHLEIDMTEDAVP